MEDGDQGWQPDDEQLYAINRCRDLLIQADESFLKGWVVLSINQWDQEQERILLLTNKAYYRVKFDFAKDQVEHHERTPLREIRFIQKGYFKVSKYTFAGLMKGNEYQQTYGIRIYAGENRSSNPFNKSQYYRTYTALPDNRSGPDGSGKAVMLEILHAISSARKAIAKSDGFYVSDYDIARPNLLGPISVAANALKLGHFSRKGEAKEGESS
eukprot:TRINITY_DN3137_c2_g1_i10.p1 TRINITY_DN3137_c2_g1~~TRINITY_DN3137_c2_g1_i10.p1  ORF type:complete len:213 (+),score=47.67 TRINITY_DN3137_c2_g1_i10:195-833(+)